MFEYYKCLARLAWRKYSEPRRLDLYEANLEKSAQIAGLLPQEVEYQLERPSKVSEILCKNIFQTPSQPDVYSHVDLVE